MNFFKKFIKTNAPSAVNDKQKTNNPSEDQFQPKWQDIDGADTDIEIERWVRKMHRQFRGMLYTTNGCGRVDLFGYNFWHASQEIEIGCEPLTFSKMANYLRENSPLFHAVAITLFRNRNGAFVKETCYINKSAKNALILETEAIGYDSDGVPLFSNIVSEVNLSFSGVANVAHDFLDALSIPY